MTEFGKITSKDLKRTLAELKSSKPRKYRNKPTMVDGIRFDSKKEAKRWGELQLLLHARKINNLVGRPKLEIRINDFLICNYQADFGYTENDVLVIEDVKSKPTMTPVYRLKKKLVRAIYGIEIREV